MSSSLPSSACCPPSSAGIHPIGRVLQVVDVVNGTFVPDMENLRFIFSQVPPETEVGIIAIAGEYRKGKSFVLNFFLQFLQHRCKTETSLLNITENEVESSSDHEWLHDIERNSGFQFRSGIKRHTTGIGMWSVPFLLKKSDGKKLAVIVIDSQGLYDSSTNSDDNVRLVTIVSLLSSSLMMNTPQNINMKQLTELKYFMDYATTGSKVSEESKPFQRLTFLLRDYTLGDLGWSGGREQLDQFMKPASGQSEEVKSLARNLTTGFSEIDAFALPFPGMNVVNPAFNGSLSLIEPAFLEHVRTFVVNITESLEARKPLILSLTAAEVPGFVANITDVFNRQLPPHELMSLNDRNLQYKAIAAINTLVRLYEDKLLGLELFKPDSYYLNATRETIAANVDKKHLLAFEEILCSFAETSQSAFKIAMGDDNKPITAMQTLRKLIEERYIRLRQQVVQMEGIRKQEAENRKEKETADKNRMKELEEKRIRLEKEREELEERIRKQNEKDKETRNNWFKAAAAAVLTYAGYAAIVG